MKKIILGMLAGCFILAASVTETKAQVHVNVNVGLWNPPAEYSGVNYYYLPDVESYYYVPTHKYVYLDGGRWVFRRALPPRYSTYNIQTGYKVAVNRPRAYTYYNTDRARYARYRGTHDRQVIIRDHYIVHNNTRVINRTHYVRPRTKVVHRKVVVRHDNGRHNGHHKH